MACFDCGTNIYFMGCLSCCARHCLMQFYPPGANKWTHVAEVADKHGHDRQMLADEIKLLKGVK